MSDLKITKNQNFDEKIVLITGASSGIGRQAAIDFANKGARAVILVARSRSKLDARSSRMIPSSTTLTSFVSNARRNTNPDSAHQRPGLCCSTLALR